MDSYRSKTKIKVNNDHFKLWQNIIIVIGQLEKKIKVVKSQFKESRGQLKEKYKTNFLVNETGGHATQRQNPVNMVKQQTASVSI